MRLWSIHPKYLDSKGLVALWREGLLAKHVLEGKTKGYTQHPQLNRFKALKDPVSAIHYYLYHVYLEAKERGYHFDYTKLTVTPFNEVITVTDGQIEFEINHLKKKLTVRDQTKLHQLEQISSFKPHPMFTIIKGDIEPWEII
jgi:hypothetical protein